MAKTLRWPAALLLLLGSSVAFAPQDSTDVLAPNALLTTRMGGHDPSGSNWRVVPAKGDGFDQALRVYVSRLGEQTNSTQLTMLNARPVRKGDALLVSLFMRGRSNDGKTPAVLECIFEKSTDPWTKSASQMVSAPKDPKAWRKAMIAVRAADSYGPGEAMLSLRFAQQLQTLEVGGLDVRNFGSSVSYEALLHRTIANQKLGTVNVRIDLRKTKQTMMGLGGNFCQPRYGHTVPMDAVGNYVLKNLNVVHARIGLPLNHFVPQPGVYKDDGQARASLLALQEMKRRRIPTVVSVWEGPLWLQGGRPEQAGRTLDRSKYGELIEMIVRYLELGRDKYKVEPAYFSFNEPDYGVNFKFTSSQMADFVRQAGPEFKKRGLKTKFIVADTANGSNFYNYAKPLLEDRSLAPYFGPLGFHSWDALNATERSYRQIGELAIKHNKEVWCLEAGWDAQLWQQPDPWSGWENGLKNAMAYVRTVDLTRASLMDYWTYQDNYPLVDKTGTKPYPVFHVMRQMQDVFLPGSRVATCTSSSDEVFALASTGPTKGRWSAILVNPKGDGKAVLSGLQSGARATVWTSAKDAQRTKSGPIAVGKSGTVTITMPSRSVVTLVSQ